MIPPSIRQNLARLRRRERLLTLAWGAACFFAVALALLFLSCLGDWLIDRERETPFEVRLVFLAVQLVAWLVAAILFILMPQIRRLPDELLALWVEAKHRKLDHRLISAVQFNRPGADVAGMSKELVSIVTDEAEKEAERVDFAKIADHRRLKWAAFVLAPAFLLIAVPLAVWPALTTALLGRQALLEIDIPHSVHELTSESPAVWPIGDTIPVQYRVKGKWDPDMVGTVTVRQLGGRPDRYLLKFIKQDGDDAIFGNDEIKPSSVNILYSARLADGRTRHPSEMKLVPRPVVMRNEAWLLLPEFCGKREDGSRYELPQPRGDVIGIPGSLVRVQFEVADPRHEAWIELRGPEKNGVKTTSEDAAFSEVPKGEPMRMEIKSAGFREVDADDGKREEKIFVAEKTFPLTEGLSGYRLFVKDDNGFWNEPKPRRALRLVPEDPPTVTLLRYSFGEDGSFDVEGMPVPLGKKIRIPYVCFGAYGLSKAQVLYRLVKEHDSSKEMPEEEEPWVRAPLPEVQPDNTAGAFDLKTGVFQNTPDGAAVPFHAVPAADPRQLGRTRGGGRVLLSTAGLIDAKGLPRTLKSGDRIEYCIEVFAMPRDPKLGPTPVARSESRVVTVKDEKAFAEWLTELGIEHRRIAELKKKQEEVTQRDK